MTPQALVISQGKRPLCYFAYLRTHPLMLTKLVVILFCQRGSIIACLLIVALMYYQFGIDLQSDAYLS